MSLNSIIRKIIKEETEEWVDVSPEEYKELLDYVNGDGSFIKRLPDYAGKKIRITGELDLRGKENVTNIDSIDLVQGNLDIGYTKIPFFDKNKVRGRMDYWGSEMQRIEKQKIYEERIAYQNELREEDAWNVENDDKESNETEAIFMYLEERGIPTEVEDKYFLVDTKYKHYGDSSVYLWLGGNQFESEYVVYNADDIYDAAKEHLESLVDDAGYDAFREHVWEYHIDERYARDYLYEDYSEMIREDPESWNIEKELTEQQKRYLEIHQANIDRLNQKLEEGGLTVEEQEEIENDINDYEGLIEDIKENPEGDYNEESIEEAIENMVDDNWENILDLMKDRGWDNRSLLDFVDMDAALDYVIRTDGYGHTLNSYDGTEDSYDINGEEYYVMRYN